MTTEDAEGRREDCWQVLDGLKFPSCCGVKSQSGSSLPHWQEPLGTLCATASSDTLAGVRMIPAILVMGALAVAQQSGPSTGGQAIGEMQLTDATVRGAVTLSPAGATLMSGSQVSAGAAAAVIRLTRGGELKVCAQSSITITASATGKETLVGLNSGALETRYRLASNADTIVTPDFRLQLPGPGDFHFAVGMKPNGDMCVKSLVGNSSAMIVNEVFGDGTHQVRPGDAVLFEKGRVTASRALAPGEDCGCVEVKLAELGLPKQEPPKAAPVAVVAETKPVEKQVELGFPEQQSQKAAAAVAEGKPVEKPAPLPQVTTRQDEVITKVDAPIVFRGEELAPKPKDEPAKAASAMPPAASAAGPVKEESKPAKPADEPPAPKPVKKRWYHRLGSAIANIFR